jgi:hypothetical protein
MCRGIAAGPGWWRKSARFQNECAATGKADSVFKTESAYAGAAKQMARTKKGRRLPMCRNNSKRLLPDLAKWLFALVMASAYPARADNPIANSNQASPKDSIKVQMASSGAVVLTATNAAVSAALDVLADKADISIRYPGAPEKKVTLNCHGNTLKQVLYCLLGDGADLIFEYSEKGIPAKVTVLASTFKDEISRPASSALENSKTAATAPPTKKQAPEEKALGLISSENPEDRASGLELLGRTEGIDKETLRVSYRAGLQDQAGEVRAAAVAGLAILDRGDSFGLLTEAMNDADPGVRLAAIDGMALDSQSRPYIERALSDSDESVRELAGLRLGLIH